jgi:hypothetical protein
MTARTVFKSEEDKRQYVAQCDADFEDRLDKMMKQI